METNQDILQSQWPALKGQIKQQWSKLTDTDIILLSDKPAELACLLRQRYGYGKAQADMEINNWLHSSNRSSTQR